MSGGLHDLADSFHQLKVAVQVRMLLLCPVPWHSARRATSRRQPAEDTQFCDALQPIAKSINHVAAGLTAVGLTLIYANWGVGSFFLGNFVFLTSLAMFHYLLRVF